MDERKVDLIEATVLRLEAEFGANGIVCVPVEKLRLVISDAFEPELQIIENVRRDVLWPDGGSDVVWSPDTIDQVARLVIRKSAARGPHRSR